MYVVRYFCPPGSLRVTNGRVPVYLITLDARIFTQAAAIYGCASGAAGNGRPCRGTRRYRRCCAVWNGDVGFPTKMNYSELAIFRGRRETDTYVRSKKRSRWKIGDAGESTGWNGEPEETALVLSRHVPNSLWRIYGESVPRPFAADSCWFLVFDFSLSANNVAQMSAIVFGSSVRLSWSKESRMISERRNKKNEILLLEGWNYMEKWYKVIALSNQFQFRPLTSEFWTSILNSFASFSLFVCSYKYVPQQQEITKQLYQSVWNKVSNSET